MIRYRLLQQIRQDGQAVPFGVAYHNDRGVFLFIPRWRSPERLPVADLRELTEAHYPSGPVLLRWSPEVEEWRGRPRETFRPVDVMLAAVRNKGGASQPAGAVGEEQALPPPPPACGVVLKHTDFPHQAGEFAELILRYTPVPIPWTSVEARIRFEKEVARAHPQLTFWCVLKAKEFFCEEVARLLRGALVHSLSDWPRTSFDAANAILARAGLYPRQREEQRSEPLAEDLFGEFARIAEKEGGDTNELAYFLYTNWN